MSAPEEIEFELDVTRWQLVLLAVVVLVLVVLALPTVQGLLYRSLAGTPSVVQWGAVSLLIAGVAYRRRSLPLFGLALVVFVLLGLVVGPVVGGVYAHADVADRMQREATQLETLPNTSKENVRMLPRTVADNFAQSSMQYPQFRLTSSDIAYVNGSYHWSYGIVPDNFLVSVLGAQRGAMYVDMTTTRKSIEVEDTEFRHGRGQLFTDSLAYRSVLHDPLALHDWDTTFNARRDGTSYVAHSTISYEWKFRLFPIPQLYAVPTFESVEVMHPDGRIESLSPSEARNSPLLRGQNVYPYSLARFRVESMQYVHGALNKWFWKEDVLEVADLPETGNEWPISVPTEGDSPGLTYFVATEPSGSGSGVYQIWTFDGQTGEAGVQTYDDAQIGPQKAVEFVDRHPQVNRLSSAESISPIPIVKGDTLYWYVKVVPRSRSGVTYTAFVNADSGDVTILEGDEPVYAFMTRSEVDGIDNGTGGDGGTTVRVVVTDRSGTIVGTRNITVPEGGNVRIEVQDEGRNASTARAGS